MKKNFSINVNELKKEMNPLAKYLLIYPIETLIFMINYIYAAIITTYFRLAMKPEISIDHVKFNTQINIDYSINCDLTDKDK